jgi:triacylglycerol lipase
MSTSRHLVDPALLAMLDAWPALTLDAASLATMRQGGRLPIGEIVDADRVAKVERIAPGRDGAPDLRLLVYRAADRDGEVLPCIYHIHGGGYVAGSAAMMEPVDRLMVEELGCVLVSVEYRLAPETPFPGPLEDCYAGLAWVFENADTVGVDRARVGVVGESAGGGLAAGLALLARDRGEYPLAFQHLTYPMIDDRTCTTRDPHPYAGEFIWTAHNNAFGWSAYLGKQPGGEGISAYAAAARATDLAGLPPTFIASGTLDLFLEESVSLAMRLLRAGVPTELHLYPGGFHAFDLNQATEIGRQARRDSWDALRRWLQRPA